MNTLNTAKVDPRRLAYFVRQHTKLRGEREAAQDSLREAQHDAGALRDELAQSKRPSGIIGQSRRNAEAAMQESAREVAVKEAALDALNADIAEWQVACNKINADLTKVDTLMTALRKYAAEKGAA